MPLHKYTGTDMKVFSLMSSPAVLVAAVLSVCLIYASPSLVRAEETGLSQVLFNNVNVFDGVNEETIENAFVLVEGDIIKQIGTEPIEADMATVIEGGGRTLMPGIIDAHWHSMFAGASRGDLMTEDTGYLYILAAKQAEATLMRGVTTVRDVGGPSMGLKQAIDGGVTPGPRIYSAGALISQTSGHGDFRSLNDQHHRFGGHIDPGPLPNTTLVADGVAEVQAAVRDQLRRGAVHIKLAAGGGISSAYDPIDVTQYSLEELKAAVGAAEDWGTYVMVHAYTPRAIKRAVEAGVKVIEHGQLLDEDTIELMARKGVWLSLQPFLSCESGNRNPLQAKKMKQVCKGTAKVYELAKRHKKLNVAWGTDLINSPERAAMQLQWLADLSVFHTPFELLKMATSTNARLLTLTGPRNPYPKPLGIVKEGAYADLLLVDGNPMEDIEVLVDQSNLRVIMKNGVVYKNTTLIQD
jgi:imidazolonepropionase-like amidohydrolase